MILCPYNIIVRLNILYGGFMNISILKNKNLRLVLLGKFVSEFGTYMQSFALSLYVLEKTGSATLFASVIVISTIPRIVLMPFAGVIADRFSRKKMIILMDILSGLSILAIASIFYLQADLSLAMIYAIVILLNAINVFFSPAMNSIIPDIVKKRNLADSNSLTELVGAIIHVIAPIAAGFLYAGFGLLLIMVVNAISFLLSALSESFIRIEKESIKTGDDKEKFFSSFMSGLRFIKSMPEFILIIIIAVLANFALIPIFSIALPIVILRDFSLSETVYGFSSSLMTIGMFLGPLFAAKIIKKNHYSSLVTTVLSFDGIVCFLIALCSINGLFPNIFFNLSIMLFLTNLLLISIIWVNISLATFRQQKVPGDMQGRIFSVMSMFSMVASPFGQALMGMLLDNNKSYIIIGIYALVLVFTGLLAKIGFARLIKNGRMDTSLLPET